MANVEDDTPDFGEFEPMDEDSLAAEPSAESGASEDLGAAAGRGALEPEEKPKKKKRTWRKRRDKNEESVGRDEVEAEEKPKKKRTWLQRRDKDVERVGRDDAKGDQDEKKDGLLEAITKADPYTVMLGVALAAVLIGILCLWMELWRYDVDIKAKGAAMAPVEVRVQSLESRV